MHKNKLIGICGVAGSGKDTIAKMILDELGSRQIDTYKTEAFARPLKEFTMNVFNLSVDEVYDQQQKEVSIVRSYRIVDLEERFNDNVEMLLNKISLNVNGLNVSWESDFGADRTQTLETYWRDMLEVIGELFVEKGVIRSLVDWWNPESANVTLETTPRLLLQLLGTEFFRNRISNTFWIDIAPKHSAILTDVRFPNEFDHLATEQGFTVGIVGRSGNIKTGGHESENVSELINRADYVVVNDGSLNQLNEHAKVIVTKVLGVN